MFHLHARRTPANVSSDYKHLTPAYCSLRNEMERNERKRNEMERNEMRICSLRNENLSFAKWKSVVCEMKIYIFEMKICSLGNDNLLFSLRLLGYSKQKFPPPPPKKKPFAPRNSDCAECLTFSLPRIATGSKTSSLFLCLDATIVVLISVITLIETICLKICPRTTAQECKKSTSGGRWNALS